MIDRPPLKRSGDDMDLPADQTCGDCVHAQRCTAMFGHIHKDELCDWSPSRFRAAALVRANLVEQQSEVAA